MLPLPALCTVSLRQRATAAELMDDPDSDEQALRRTLQQFSMINRLLTGMRPVVRREVLGRMEALIASGAVERDYQFTVLDAGAGGCDIPCWLIGEASRRGISLRVIAVDADERVVSYARQAAESCISAGTLDLIHGSALEFPGEFLGESPEKAVDFIMANHFLHHLSDHEIAQFLRTAVERCRYGVIINDIARSRISLIGYWLLTLVTFRNSFARYDGMLSIMKGFRRRELLTIAATSISPEKGTVHVTRAFPGRLILKISPNP
jgi:2-polyprenyl-3-methyl-5-hydroxy-6-metoxy-1,4-benzoquinol methylase